MNEPEEHHAFTLAKSLPEAWRSRFPKSPEEARGWSSTTRTHALARRVLAVARTRVECAWAAYIDAVPGSDHEDEAAGVLANGDKLSESVARNLFPEFDGVPYAE